MGQVKLIISLRRLREKVLWIGHVVYFEKTSNHVNNAGVVARDLVYGL